MWARVGKGQKKLCKNESQIQCDLFIVEQVDVLVSPYNCSTLEQRWRKRARKERFFIRKNISRSKEKTYVPPGKLEITDVPICAAIYFFVTFFLFAIGFSCFERKKEREERGRQGEGGWGEESGRQGESERDEKMRGREKSEKERKKGKRKERRGNAWGWNKMFKKGTRKKNESILPLKRKKWTVTYAGLFYFKKKKAKTRKNSPERARPQASRPPKPHRRKSGPLLLTLSGNDENLSCFLCFCILANCFLSVLSGGKNVV